MTLALDKYSSCNIRVESVNLIPGVIVCGFILMPTMEAIVERFPALNEAEVDKLTDGVECYTPDGTFLVGEVPGIEQYYIAAGMNGFGVSLAAGVGGLVASWITGHFTRNIARQDVSRFLDLHSNAHFLTERTPEVASNSYIPQFTNVQYETARNIRRSPIHNQLAEVGAVFGEVKGYERPVYFATQPEHVLPSHRKAEDSNKQSRYDLFNGPEHLHHRPPWFDCVASEYEACRERVGLIDMSNFTKFDVYSPEVPHSEQPSVTNFLQYVCSANVDVPVGHTAFTGVQNEQGGYVTDCTVSRLTRNHYFIIAPTVQQVGTRIWLEKQARQFENIVIQDVTSMYTALNIVGPASRPLMERLTHQVMGSTEFPAFRCKDVDIGLASGIRAISVTHCGELGWVLYIPNELAAHVYDKLVLAGSDFGLQHCGFYTLRHLRVEKFYVYWGFDIGFTTTPLECGRDFRVDYSKDFIGKAALQRQSEEGIYRRYVQLTILDHDSDRDVWPQGREPIYRDGVYAGMTTSAAYAFTFKKQMALGFVQDVDVKTGIKQKLSEEFVRVGEYEIDIGDKRFAVELSTRSPTLPIVDSSHPKHYMAAK